jgi:hypothetical protein
MTAGRRPVHRRSDNELVGFIEPIHAEGAIEWRPLTVFGGQLGQSNDSDTAVATVIRRGLASLMEKWWFYSHDERRWRRVQLIEVRPESVRAQNGPYPDSDKLVIKGTQLATLTLAEPATRFGELPPDRGDWPE